MTVAALAPISGPLLVPAAASAGPAGGLCRMDTARGEIPASFAVDGCFDGKRLVLRNTLSLALTPLRSGDVSASTTESTDFGLAALATRSVAGDEVIFLPGDKLTFPIGAGVAKVGLKGSKHGGFFALATTLATFFPFKTGAAYESFTTMVTELGDVLEQYRTCLDGKNWLAQLGCRALFVRNVEFALTRAAVSGLAKGALEAVLSGVTFTKWADAQVPEVRKVLGSETIKLSARPVAPDAAPQPDPAPAPPADGGGADSNATEDGFPSCNAFNQLPAAEADAVLRRLAAAHDDSSSPSLLRFSVKLFCRLNAGRSIAGVYSGGSQGGGQQPTSVPTCAEFLQLDDVQADAVLDSVAAQRGDDSPISTRRLSAAAFCKIYPGRRVDGIYGGSG